MKKLITTLFSLFVFLGLSAQTEQGSFMLGTNTEISFNSTTEFSLKIGGDEPEDYEPSKAVSSVTAADLKFGVFVIDNLALGALVNYSSQQIDYNDSDIENPDPYTTTGYGAFTRYYIGGVAFIGASYVMNTSSDWDDLDKKPTQNIMSGEAGFSLFINDNIAFTPSVSYGIRTNTLPESGYNDDGDLVDIVAQDALLNITAGLTIHF